MQSRKSKIYTLTRCALFAAILCIVSPFVIPVGAIPFSLAIMAVMLVANFFSVRESFISVITFILVGIVGIPVFSGFQGGLGVLTGPTGGFVISYIPVAILVSLARNQKFRVRLSVAFGAMILCYLIGTAHFVVVTKESSFISALALCVVPFVVPDVIKIFVATYIGGKIGLKLQNQYTM